MFECLLLMHRAGATWVPLIAIPAGIAGWVAAMWLILSGIKGILAARSSKGNTDLVAGPASDVKWIGTQLQPVAQGRSSRPQILNCPTPGRFRSRTGGVPSVAGDG